MQSPPSKLSILLLVFGAAFTLGILGSAALEMRRELDRERQFTELADLAHAQTVEKLQKDLDGALEHIHEKGAGADPLA